MKFSTRLVFVFMLCLCAALWAAPASAQLSRVGNSIGLFGNPPPFPIRGSDIGYDPVHDVYLVVGGHGFVYGAWVDHNGVFVAGTVPFAIGTTNFTTWGAFPRCKYSQDINGGQGGFLVAWHQPDPVDNFVHTQIVAYPTGVISVSRPISNKQTFFEAGPAIAYSPTSHRFLVAWQTGAFEIHGRFVELDGSPTPGFGVMPFENPNTGRDPGLTWNPATNDFGLSYTGFGNVNGAFAAFRRIGAATGALSPRALFGFTAGTYNSDIDVNPRTHHYVVGFARDQGSSSQEIDETGALIGTPSLISSQVGGSTSLSLAFNVTSGTFLAVGQDPIGGEIVGAELNAQGVPTSGKTILTNGGGTSGSFYPRVTAKSGAGQWNISYSRQLTSITNQIVATTSRDAGVKLQVEAPVANASVSNPFNISGWAVDTRSTTDAGIDEIDVYAYPHWNAAPVFMGALPGGSSPRADVAASFGPTCSTAGWTTSVANLSPGPYMLVFYPHSKVTGQFEFDRVATVEINVRGGIYTQIDTPAWNSTNPGGAVGMVVSGWALNFDATIGTGIDRVDIWAMDAVTGANTYLGTAATGGIRPDVGAAFGANFISSGYSLTNQQALTPGLYYIAAYSHSPGAGGTFNLAKIALVRITQ